MSSSEKAPLTEAEKLPLVLGEIVSSSNRLALKVVVLEAAVMEAVASMAPVQKRLFADKFKARIADIMQLQADRLLPCDDEVISLAARNVLRAV